MISKLMNNFTGKKKQEKFKKELESNEKTIEKQYKRPEFFMQPLNSDLFSKNLTPYDKEVLSGICTILETEQNNISPRQIHEAMTGRATTNSSALDMVKESIEKMQNITVELELDERIICAPLISPKTLDREYFYDKNKKATCRYKEYYFKDMSPLFHYFKKTGQICKTDKAVLQVPDVRNVTEHVLLKNYLIRYVENIKKNKSKNNVLTYETLFSRCMIDNDPKNLARKRNVVSDILSYWRMIGYIKQFVIIQKGNKDYAIEIIVRTLTEPIMKGRREIPKKEKPPRSYRYNLCLDEDLKPFLTFNAWTKRTSITQYLNDLIRNEMKKFIEDGGEIDSFFFDKK